MEPILSIALYIGDRDPLATIRDSMTISNRLCSKNYVEGKVYENYDHLAFAWGKTAHVDIYPTILERIAAYENEQDKNCE